MKSTTLYFNRGSSDKVYRAEILELTCGYVVNIAYGRRGHTLYTGTKTPTPVTLEEAQSIYTKVLREKTAKGYHPGEEGTAYTPSSGEYTAIHCQLLNPIEESQLEYFINDAGYWMQDKYDGRRLLLIKEGNAITGINRQGCPVGIPKSLEKAAKEFTQNFIIDGESIGDVLHVFDILTIDELDIRKEVYAGRCLYLSKLLASQSQENIQMVRTAFTPQQKRQMLVEAREKNKEGIVFKRLDAPYTEGRPASGGTQFKFKFCESASCIVGKVNSKRSVRMEMFDEERLVSVGNVTIPANHEIPTPGSVIECRYLYAFPGGCLFQPVYKGQRDDIPIQNCVVAQLKFKAEPIAA